MNEYLLNILVCPKSGDPLEYSKDTNELICKKSRLAYPIRNNIPVLLIDEARKIDI
tara:strand:- start:367 stop:534 length:168 start_codon:yes stop_codon:yes gene_type:complete